MSISLTASPPGTDLITQTRALQEPALAALNATNVPAVAGLISAASAAIERACKRVFTARDYSLYLSIGPRTCDWIALPNFPVIAVSRLACNPQPGLAISNSDGTTHQRATVSNPVSGTVRLTTTSAGVNNFVDLPLATYPTISALAAAISVAGSGWSATALEPWGNFPSADLRPVTIALSVLNRPGSLEVFTEDLSPWPSAQHVWDWAASSPSATTGWQLDPDAGLIVGRFADALEGPMCVRCDYRAGFEIVPADVQQACARLAALIAEDGQRNSTVLQQTVGPYTQKFYPAAAKLISNAAVMELIRPYIDHAKTIGHLWP